MVVMALGAWCWWWAAAVRVDGLVEARGPQLWCGACGAVILEHAELPGELLETCIGEVVRRGCG